jgi:hypothetical protein
MASVFLRVIETDIAEIARAKQLTGFRVDHKVNGRGELVIALILPCDFAHHAEEVRPPRKHSPLR